MKSKLKLAYLVFFVALSCNDDKEPEPSDTFEGDVWLLKQADVVEFGKKKYNKITGGLIIGDDCATNGHCELSSDIYDLTPLNTITHVNGAVHIGARSLRSLGGLESLVHVGGIKIDVTPITSLEAFSNIDSVGYIVFETIDVSDLHGLHNLKYIKKHFQLISSSKVQSLRDLKALGHVEDLALLNLDTLKSLEGLENINSVNNLAIFFNNQLTDLCGIVPMIKGGQSGAFQIYENGYNPTKDDLLNDNCSN